MNYVLLKSFEHMVDEIEEIINGDLDFTDTFQAIIDLELKQLKVFSPVFSENLMTQYSESPDFFDTDAHLPQAKIYENLFEKGQKAISGLLNLGKSMIFRSMYWIKTIS